MKTNKKTGSKPDPPKTSRAIFDEVFRAHDQHTKKEEQKEDAQNAETAYMKQVVQQIREGYSFYDIVCIAITSGGESYAIVRRNWSIIKTLSDEAKNAKKFEALGRSLALAEYNKWSGKLIKRYKEFFNHIKLSIPQGYSAVYDQLDEYERLKEEEIEEYLNVIETESYPSKMSPAQRALFERAQEYNTEIHTKKKG